MKLKLPNNSKPTIVFVYAARYEFSGSTIMRGAQLLKIVEKFYSKEYTLRYEPLSTNFRNSIVFLTKGAVTDITGDQIDELKRRGNKVLLDPVDNPLDTTKAKRATAIIAASLEAFDSYRKAGYRSYIVNHHVDTRIKHRENSKQGVLRIGYFGELVNTIITDNIASRVEFVHVDTGTQTNEWLDKPMLYNLHYAVRANNVEAFKPFLKGFTAAACNANIIIQRDQVEAIRWLGKDYPYLLDANPSEATILNMLSYIKQTYGGDEWNRALEIMTSIQQKTSEEAIANELATAIQDITKR